MASWQRPPAKQIPFAIVFFSRGTSFQEARSMNGIKQVWGCVVVGWCIAVLTVGVQAQEQADSPFGDASGGVVPRAEKSLLAEGVAPAIDYGKALEYCQCVGQSQSSTVQKIEQALKAPLTSSGLDFTEQPLNDVITQLQDEYGIPIQIDYPALEAIGVRSDEQITINIQNTSLRSALRLMLKSVQLTYVIQDEVLMITTPDEAEKRLKDLRVRCPQHCGRTRPRIGCDCRHH